MPQIHDPLLVSYYNSRSATDLNQLAINYMPLVRHVVSKLIPASAGVIEQEEAMSAAQMGLTEALMRFVPYNTPSSFTNFAIVRIRGAIYDSVRRNGPNRYRKTPTWKSMDDVASILTQELKRNPSIDEIAIAIHRTPEAVAHRMQLQRMEFCSLEAISVVEDTAPEEILSSLEDVPSSVESAIMLETLRRLAARTLTAVEFFVLQEIYFADRTVSQVHEELKVSITRVSQWHRRALSKMKTRLGAKTSFDALEKLSA